MGLRRLGPPGLIRATQRLRKKVFGPRHQVVDPLHCWSNSIKDDSGASPSIMALSPPGFRRPGTAIFSDAELSTRLQFASSTLIEGAAARRLAFNKEMQSMSSPFRSLLTQFISDEPGATAIEYGLIASLIAVASIATLTSVGTKLNAKFGEVANGLS
jgi:pilus assembly protein Flp/PilA